MTDSNLEIAEVHSKAAGGQRSVISFLGISIDVLDTDGLLERIITFAYEDTTRLVMYVNTDCMLISLDNDSYKQVLNTADLVYADGVGVVLGAKIWGKTLPGRSTGADFMPGFCEIFSKYGLRLFFLGAQQEVVEEAASQLRGKVPDLKIVGTHHGYFKEEETSQIIRLINEAKPHVLIVGMGAPCQELWISKNRELLKVPVLWGVGGLFDFLSGRTKRGPQWLLDNGFEWLCRLFVEPKRLWKRYLIGNVKFIAYLLWFRFTKREFD